MKISRIINAPLRLVGLKLIRETASVEDPSPDISHDTVFMGIYQKIKPYTMTSIERCYALYQAVNHIVENKIQGDFVECGVWKGGSVMLIIFTLLHHRIGDREIYLYDTFEGMTKPGEHDGTVEKQEWEKFSAGNNDSSNWCLSPIEEVRSNVIQTGYSIDRIHFIKGKVEETIPSQIPAQIALLRLDTDWYESTRHELVHLYPLIPKMGVLIIDDYGAWQGARKATDEYFADKGVFLHRIDLTGRILVK